MLYAVFWLCYEYLISKKSVLKKFNLRHPLDIKAVMLGMILYIYIYIYIYMNLELKGEIWIADINLGAISYYLKPWD